jgi:hypothetical protein
MLLIEAKRVTTVLNKGIDFLKRAAVEKDINTFSGREFSFVVLFFDPGFTTADFGVFTHVL